MKTKKQGRIRSFYRNLLEEFHKDKSTFIIYITLRTLVILIAVLQFLNGNYENAMLCVFTLLLFLIPAFVQATFRVELPSALEIIVLFFIFAAEILGEINDYYVKYAFWDTMLHTANGFLAAAVGLSLIDILNKSERVQLSLSPLFVALTSFCFSMTIGVLWEFFEFGMDYFFSNRHAERRRSHAYFLGLPKSGERQPRRADQKYHRYSGQRAKSRDQRVSGHRPLRHDERSAGQFCGRGGLFDHWILFTPNIPAEAEDGAWWTGYASPNVNPALPRPRLQPPIRNRQTARRTPPAIRIDRAPALPHPNAGPVPGESVPALKSAAYPAPVPAACRQEQPLPEAGKQKKPQIISAGSSFRAGFL